MRSVKIAELKDHLSEHLRAVERGNEIEVTDRDRPIAHIVPIRHATPLVHLIPAKRPFREIRDERCPPARWKISSLELLMEERGKR